MEKKNSVTDPVKEGFKSYSSVVSASQPTAPVICQKALKSDVKSAVEEEGHSRNLLVFGLPEEEEEGFETRVSEVLEELCLTPKLKAQRIGKKKSSNVIRPVKVCISSSLIIHQILGITRNMGNVDRSPEQQEACC